MSEMGKPKTETTRSAIFTIADEVMRVDARRPHVVIVGSGASAAAFPNGDRNGKTLPTMPNFASTLGLDSVLHRNGIPPSYEDFEGIYTGLVFAIQANNILHDWLNKLLTITSATSNCLTHPHFTTTLFSLCDRKM